jgi:hypothetical protein
MIPKSVQIGSPFYDSFPLVRNTATGWSFVTGRHCSDYLQKVYSPPSSKPTDDVYMYALLTLVPGS